MYTRAYTSDEHHFRDGIQHFSEFSLDYHAYLKIFPSASGFRRLSEDVRSQFYAFDDERWVFLALKYGISYFIMRKRRMRTHSRLKCVYENQVWVVLRAD